MKTLTDFVLKEEYKLLQSIGDKIVEIDSLIDWKLFRIIFEFIHFKKTVS
jgi:IS5 family transposase